MEGYLAEFMSHSCEETVSFINPRDDLKPRDNGAAAQGSYDSDSRADVSRLQFRGVSGTVLDTHGVAIRVVMWQLQSSWKNLPKQLD